MNVLFSASVKIFLRYHTIDLLQSYEMMASQASKQYTILIPHTKVTRESALNVCKTKLKIKHKPDHKGSKEDKVDDGMQGFLHAILDCEIFNLTEKECAISLLCM